MPSLHAILIGVSAYDELGQTQPGATVRKIAASPLDGPCRTVAALAEWLQTSANTLCAPLGSLEILASPSPSEAGLPALAGCSAASTPAVIEALQRWRAAATMNAGDFALFYFAGHGLQRSRNDAVMLLQDFNTGRTLLQNAISLADITGGMGSTGDFPNVAGTQLYFADCCRSIVPALAGYETAATAPVFDPEIDVAAVRSSPIFLAANGGRETFTQPGGFTYFGGDLITCLNGAGADRLPIDGGASEWVITAQTLSKAMALLAADYNRQQDPAFRRSMVAILAGDDPVLRKLDQPPLVCCTIRPSGGLTQISLRDPPQMHQPPFSGLDRFHLPAGVYFLGGTLSSTGPDGGAVVRDIPAATEMIMPPFYVRDYHPV